MRKLSAVLLIGSALAFSATAMAQGTAGSKAGSSGKQDLISKADTNGDGKVSRDEFLAYEQSKAEKMFDRLDTNKDGFIEKSELGNKRAKRHRTQ